MYYQSCIEHICGMLYDNHNRNETCKAVFVLTNLIFLFSLWRALSCIQTAEVTELSVSLFYIAFCNDLAGDSAWFHCVLWSFTHLGYRVYFDRHLFLFSEYLITLCHFLCVYCGKLRNFEMVHYQNA
jgi:hypothetical protein